MLSSITLDFDCDELSTVTCGSIIDTESAQAHFEKISMVNIIR